MSRRDSSYHTKRISSKVEREPSPKRSRRDGKPETERTSSGHNLETADSGGPDQKHRRRLQDALPLEVPVAPVSKSGEDVVNKGFNKKSDGQLNGTNRPSDATEVPRSQSYFQHDERGSAGQGGRSFSRRERGRWSDPKDRSGDRVGDKMEVHDTQKRDVKIQVQSDENTIWRHDGFFELQADAPPLRRRPAFREKKLSPELVDAAGAVATESAKPSHLDRPVMGSMRREEKGGYRLHGSDKAERSVKEANERTARAGDWGPHRGEIQRVGYSSRERFNAGGGSRGRERFNGRYGDRNQDRQGGFHVEKWKHDLFDEANRSPTPKNEEDQIAKVEALLAL
ncbi:hypothetical protein AAC387_Pa05g2649 [Persea americana]